MTNESNHFKTDPVLSSGSLSQALESFLLALQVSGRAHLTLQLYRRSVEPLIIFLGDRPITDISPGNLRSFLAYLGTKVNPVTVNIRWRSIRSFLTGCIVKAY